MSDSAPPPILDVLRERRSPSVFDPAHELSVDQVTVLFEAARWAPSYGNGQPWAYVVGRRGDATHQRIVQTLSRGNAGWVPAASAVALTVVQNRPHDADKFAPYARFDVGQSVAHLCVQAGSMGLAVHQFAGFDHAALAALFEVPEEWSVLSAIAIGRAWPVDERRDVDPGAASREERERTRKPLREFLFGNGFGHPFNVD